MHIVTAGALGYLDEEDDAVILNAGNAVTTVDGEPGDIDETELEGVVSVGVPIEVLTAVQAPVRHLLSIGAEVPLLAPTAAFASSIADGTEPEMSAFSAYYFERLLQEMVIGLLVEASRAHHVPRSPHAFTLALTFIAAQRADPELTPRVVAREVNLSLRQLERVFRQRDTTVAREIRRRRVEQASDLLRSSAYAGLSVDQVAQLSGFSNGSSLARAMAGEGLPSPTAVRASPPTS